MAYEKNRKGNVQNLQTPQTKEQKIIIAERDNIATVMENGKVTDFFIQRGDVILGDVYLATVDNILPSIDAAFVNVGSDKMGFLHAQDVMGKGALKDKLSPKQKLVVQVVKEPNGHKGPRVTTEVSLPGRFLVLMPNEPGISVSKKIDNSKERARLKSIVSLIKPVGVGVIIRTEAEGLSEADIQEDLEILLEKWNNIVTSAETLTPPNLIYRDQDLLYRVIREACSENTKEIIVDTAFALNRVQTILQNWHMNKNVQVNLYRGTEPILIATDVHKEIKSALNAKVNMPSGGYLFVQTTEALTVIDVNSGKFTSSSTQDETILKTNIEAVHEIARQLRLRNIGGMIIIDFIDMISRADKLAIMEELEMALEPDKAKPQVGQLSDLGLVELTRHRQGQSLSEIFTKKCPHCHGSGHSVIDFNFSTPTAEGEYRAKAAKMKLPINNGNNKFKNNNNKNNNKPQQEEIVEVQEIVDVAVAVENPSTVANSENNNRKRNNNRRNRFDKNKQNKELDLNQEGQIQTAQTVIKPDEEIKPVIATTVVEEVVEVVATVVEEVKKAKPSRNKKVREVKTEEVSNVEIAPVGNVETIDAAPVEVVEDKPKRRPNRGASKKSRTTKSTETGEGNVEEK
ncbi:MAG: Rne/Rng family ribonuclease [Candidatus Gastranaerophilales bacterium]